VIKTIDPKTGTLALQHGPIPAVSWPAKILLRKHRIARHNDAFSRSAALVSTEVSIIFFGRAKTTMMKATAEK
jgi:hypothetical protein